MTATIRHPGSPEAAPAQARGERRRLIAQAALQILGDQGSRALTHRAIDKLLDMPEGTTSAYFRRREDLVGAAVRELFQSDFALFEARLGSFLASDQPLTLDQVVDFFMGMIRNVRHNLDSATQLARYECFLLARRDKEANRLLMDMFQARQELDQRLFERLGAADPKAAACRLGYLLRGTFFTLAFLPEPAERLDLINEEFLREQILLAMRADTDKGA